MDGLTNELETAGRVIRNEKDEIIVKTGKYWNIEVLDIRWYSEDKPTRKGIRMNKEEAKMLLKILKRELNETV